MVAFASGLLTYIIESRGFGGAFASLTQKPLKNWMEQHCTNTMEEYRNNFMDSCVAYCMSTWVLGVGDRHNDNIMVKKV